MSVTTELASLVVRARARLPRRPRGASRADEVVSALTRDGWRLALHRYRPRGTRRREPVLLCHGLAASAATWDLSDRPSLAPWLAARGHEVFALDLRGAGASERPRLLGPRAYTWGVHEYLFHDVPAAVERVCELVSCERIHWVGHSMGGILLLALAARELGSRLRSAVTLGSALDYAGSAYAVFAGLAGFARLVRALPVGSLSRLYSPFPRATFLDDFMFARGSLAPDERRALWSSVFTWVPGKVLAELATTFEPGGFRGRDGERWLEGLPRIATPVCVVAGTRDVQCPPAAAHGTFEALGSRAKRFLVVPGAGHFDLVVGAKAEREVFPEIARWIEGI